MFKVIASAMFITATAIFVPGVVSTGTPVDDIATPMSVEEDSSGWNCVTMGNRVCGPDQGVTAGCYNDNEELVASWPCFVVVDDDGNADVYTARSIAWRE